MEIISTIAPTNGNFAGKKLDFVVGKYGNKWYVDVFANGASILPAFQKTADYNSKSEAVSVAVRKAFKIGQEG